MGILEVKCPRCKRDNYIQEASEDKGFYLENKGGKLKLNHNHSYIYQIQTQLYMTKSGYCDFVVWTNMDAHVERIQPDTDLFHTALQKVETFFKCCVLPDILGKWYTRSVEIQVIGTDKLQNERPSLLTKPVICYCRKVDPTEDMICSS